MHPEHHSSEPVPSSRNASLDTWGFRILLATSALTPLVFVTSPYIALEIVKSLVISLGVLISSVCIILSTHKKGHLTLLPQKVSWAFGIFGLSLLASTLFSGHMSKSFFGQGFEFATAGFTLILLLAVYVAYVYTRDHISRVKYLYVAMSIPFMLLALFHWVRIIIALTGTDIFAGTFLPTITSTIIGSWYTFGAYAAFVMFLALSGLLFTKMSSGMRKLSWVLVGVGFLSVCVVQYVVVWQAATVATLLLAYAVYRYGAPGFVSSAQASPSRRVSGALVILTLVFALCAWKGAMIIGPVVDTLNTQYAEIVLPWSYTTDIAVEVTKTHPLFGTGPNSFFQAYVTSKPLEINQTPVWNAEFNVGSSALGTYVATLGGVGVLALLLLLGVLALCLLRIYRKMPEDPAQRSMLIVASVLSMFLWFMIVFSIPSLHILFYASLMTGIMLSLATSYGVIHATTYPLKSEKTGLVHQRLIPVLPMVLVILCIVWGAIYIKKVVALSYFSSGVQALTITGNTDQAYDAFQKALIFDTSDIYRRAEVESLLAKAVALIRGDAGAVASSTPEELNVRIIGTINDALKAASRAIAYDPTNYYNYASEARVFEVAANLKMKGSVEGAIASYTKAIAASPRNPQIHLNLARFYASEGKFDEAIESTGTALKIKPNYLDAIFLLSQIYVTTGRVEDAITATRVATEIDPSSAVAWFQLGFLYYSDKQYSQAVDMLSKALALQSDYANAQYFLGLAYAYQNKRSDAIKQFEALTVSNPASQEVALILKNLKAGNGPFEDARAPVTPAPEKRSTLPLDEDES
ncbi:MAG: tetratricopeptide repeat protein [Patescibacteria group bacterium]